MGAPKLTPIDGTLTNHGRYAVEWAGMLVRCRTKKEQRRLIATNYKPGEGLRRRWKRSRLEVTRG
jgi:hypothetical protein